MPPPNKKAKHLGDARSNALIRKHNQNAIKRTYDRKSDTWAAMS